MLNIPVSNPRIVQLITVAAGVATVLVAQFVPTYSVLLSQILQVLGIGVIGVGGAQITGKSASPGDSVAVGAVPQSKRPPEGFDAECRAWRPAWRLRASLATLSVWLVMAALVALGAVLQGCSSDRSRDVRYAIAGARGSCLLWQQAREHLTKEELAKLPETPEAEAVCPLLLEPAPATRGCTDGAGGSE